MAYEDNVFINCPFDKPYESLFSAIIFTVHDCGFIARCALELSDSSTARIDKIYSLIDECQLGIHDISRTQLDPKSRLPRFNMPFELGLFLGARRFGDDKNKRKKCLILDTTRYRFQSFCSDIAGQDIEAHDGNVDQLVRRTRHWLRQWTKATVPGDVTMQRRFAEFSTALPLMCESAGLDVKNLEYLDLQKFIVGWLQENG